MPNVKKAHIDQALTTISVGYLQDEASFVADKVFPKVPVKRQSDVYYVYNKGDFFRDEARVRSGSSESAGGDYGVEADTPYYCKVHAFHKDVNEQERANYDDPLDADEDATDFVSQKMLIRRETQWANSYFATGKWTQEFTGVAASPTGAQFLKFSDPASDPIGFITGQIIATASKTGKKPNVLVMSPTVFNVLANHEDILDKIKYTQRGVVTEDLLAALLRIDKLVVAWGVVNSANKGATDDIDFIMGDHMLLVHVPKKPGLKTASAGYIFTWTGLKGAGAYGNRIVRIPMDMNGLGTERIEGEIAFDAKKIADDLGVFFADCV